jgi:hypothetical protein
MGSPTTGGLPDAKDLTAQTDGPELTKACECRPSVPQMHCGVLGRRARYAAKFTAMPRAPTRRLPLVAATATATAIVATATAAAAAIATVATAAATTAAAAVAATATAAAAATVAAAATAAAAATVATAATAAATEAAAAAATAAAEATAPAFLTGLGFIDAQRTTIEVGAVHGLDRRLGVLVIRHLDEREAARATRVAIEHDLHFRHLTAITAERRP